MKRSFSTVQRRILAWVAAGRCKQCGVPLDKHFHADHIVAFSKGGATITANGQALCATCNLWKSNR